MVLLHPSVLPQIENASGCNKCTALFLFIWNQCKVIRCIFSFVRQYFRSVRVWPIYPLLIGKDWTDVKISSAVKFWPFVKNRKWKWINRRKGNVRPRREKSASLASRMPRDCNPSHDPRAPGLRVASSSDVHLVPSWLSFEDLTSGILGTSWTGWRIDCNSSHGNQSQLGLSPVR